jgi:plasmid stability protein
MKLRTLTIRGLPEPLLKTLRSAAKRSRRSLNAEVLVRLEAGAAAGAVPAEPTAVVVGHAAVGPAAPTARVSEPVGQPYEVRRAFAEERAALLESDLRMTPEERVLYADKMLDEALSLHPRPKVHTLRLFDSWEDYLSWKRTDCLL